MTFDISCLSVLYDVYDNVDITDNSFNRMCITNGLNNGLLQYDFSCNDTTCQDVSNSSDLYDSSNIFICDISCINTTSALSLAINANNLYSGFEDGLDDLQDELQDSLNEIENINFDKYVKQNQNSAFEKIYYYFVDMFAYQSDASHNIYNLYTNNKSNIIFTLIVSIIILLIFLFFYKVDIKYNNKYSEYVESVTKVIIGSIDSKAKQGILFAILVLLFAIFGGLFLFTLGHIQMLYRFIVIIVSLVCIAGFSTLLYTLISTDKNKTDAIKNQMNAIKVEDFNDILELLQLLLLYIPCIIKDFIEEVKKEYNITTKTEIIIFVLDIILILALLNLSNMYNALFNSSGTILLKEPIYLNNETHIQSYDELIVEKDILKEDSGPSIDVEIINVNKSSEFSYRYCVSCWIYINYQLPSTNENYTKWTNIFSYGNKPKVEYCGYLQDKDTTYINNYRIIMQDNDEMKTIYQSSDIPSNVWNYFVFNYDGGTLDVFINGELVKSRPEIIPYMSYDKILTGENNGINGGICNIKYYENPISINEIKNSFNNYKNKTPPY